MIKKWGSIVGFIVASIFLLALLAQPIHQYLHWEEHTSHCIDNQAYDLCNHNGHITSSTHCELCDFTISPILEFTFPLVLLPAEFTIDKTSVDYFYYHLPNSQNIQHKQLRAPPSYT